MLVLLDKNVPYPLIKLLSAHTVKTVEQENWGTLLDSQLLGAAENKGYDVLVTCDQNIVHQQNLTNVKMALVIIDTNIWPIIRANPGLVVQAVSAASPGSHQTVNYPKPKRP